MTTRPYWTATRTCSRWTTEGSEVTVRFVLSLSFSYSRVMSLSNLVGAGHRRSALERRLQTVGAANVVTRLMTQAVTGCAHPMEVHQHYGYEFHLLLTDTSCIHRVFATAGAMRRVCTQLERGLVGLCSCGYDANRMVSAVRGRTLCTGPPHSLHSWMRY